MKERIVEPYCEWLALANIGQGVLEKGKGLGGAVMVVLSGER